MQQSRAGFGSKIGVVMAAAGSAVGLGNIWRFSTETGNNGGAAFILLYLCSVMILGLPLLVSEFLIGRHTRANTASAYSIIAPGTPYKWVGRAGVASGTIILCYYIVVAGWTLYYLVMSLTGMLRGEQDFALLFNTFVSSPWKPLLAMLAFMAMTHAIIVMGVQKGIERSSKVMMPFLLLIIAVLVVCSFSMPGTYEGLRFLFKPDFSKLTPDVALSAMGQAFYSLSLAMGCLCTYASYFSSGANLFRTAWSVAVIDTFVAVMAGLIIFPAVFSVPGLRPDEGAGLVFITLPNVFNMAFAHAPLLGYFFSTMFYLLLVVATLTSAISLHEVPTLFFHERFRISRARAAWVTTLLCGGVGVFCALSFGPLSHWQWLGMGLFDWFDYIPSKFLMPLGGMFTCVMVGWHLDRRMVQAELTNHGALRFRLMRAYIFCVRYVAPAAIAIIFVNQILRVFSLMF